MQPGLWHLTATAPGYELCSPVPVQVPGLATAELVMVPGAAVSGVVHAPSGEPVSQARVHASGAPDSSFDPVVETEQTNREGAFELSGIRARNITMQASARGWSGSEPFELKLETTGDSSPDGDLKSMGTRADENGRFHIEHCHAGSYRLFVSHDHPR